MIMNSASTARSRSIRGSGKHPGVFAIVDFFLDDLFPNTLGKPIFGGEESTAFDPWHAFNR